MTTQSLRGMDNHGPIHWRGDRTGGNDEPSAQPNSGSFDEDAALKKFNPAFSGLLGREERLPSDAFHNCNGCHVLNPDGNREHGVARPGFFGTDGKYSFEAETQFMKVPHLRNLYQKVGMFGMPGTFGLQPDGVVPLAALLPPPPNDEEHQGDQVRGFGFLHDGSVDTLFRFFGATAFVQRGFDATLPCGIMMGATEQTTAPFE